MITNLEDYKATLMEEQRRSWQAKRMKELQTELNDCLKAAKALQYPDAYMIIHTLECVIRLATEAVNAQQRGK